MSERNLYRSSLSRRAHRGLLTGFAVCFALIVSFLTAVPDTPAQAVTASDFSAGNIISDSNFYTGTNFSAAEIQTFLEQQVPRCTLGDAGRAPGTAWGNSKLAQNCLRDYTAKTNSRAANVYCSAYPGAAKETAAQIIEKVAKACSISPKVLLVLLEKEQSLVTDSWPTERQFSFAMGYNCPDSGPNNSANCDSTDSGFAQQVYRSAWQFQVYKAHPNNYRYKAKAHNQIQWHPNASCGSANVFIENSATAALYIYTPYQPNAAALNAGWGTGNSCSSYGNRNFFLLYNKWFGPSVDISHAAVDSAVGVYRGIEVSGWARHLDSNKRTEPAWMWANVYGTNGALITGVAFKADQPLSWFNNLYPGWGNNHGFRSLIPVAPGQYSVKIYNSSVNSEHVATKSVTVPVGQGHLDSVTSAVGGVRVQGWSVDFRTQNPDTIRVVVNGKNQSVTHQADVPLTWINTLFPGSGDAHGFDFIVEAPPGTHQVCIYGATGKLGCETVRFTATEHGSFDSAVPTADGIRLTGWALNTRNSTPVAVSYTVNGKAAGSTKADTSLGWFDSYWPGAGPNHGFDVVTPITESGTYEVCAQIQGGSTQLGCKTVTLRQGQHTSVDSITAQGSAISVSGWSAVFGSPATQYVWINVDGVGAAYKADQTLTWFDRFAPGSGNNHGFAVQIPAASGTHEVCVYVASTGALVRCESVTISAVEQGHVDSVVAKDRSIRVTGWAHQLGQPAPSFVWIDVNGVGSAHRASAPVSWFNNMFPGQGTEHGIDVTLPATPGKKQVCVFAAATATALGCTTVTVQ